MTTGDSLIGPATDYLGLPQGRIAYDVAGDGPLIVLVPGMGDLRTGYRFLAPALRSAGYRVASVDLRGHGDSDPTFSSYGDVETASDVLALVEHLGGPAVIVGNSMGAAAAVIAAARKPHLITGLVLVGPFVRDPKVSWAQRALLRLALAPAWAAQTWKAYLPKLYAGRLPADFSTYRDSLVAAIRRPGYGRAFALTTRTSHAPAEASLAEVSAPVLVVMGERDPDFPDPRGEADWVATALHGRVVMVPEAGHYPQSQRPDVTTTAIVDFMRTLAQHG